MLSISDNNGVSVGTGFCLAQACHLEFAIDTISVGNTPGKANFNFTLMNLPGEIKTLGTESLGPVLVYFSDDLIRQKL